MVKPHPGGNRLGVILAADSGDSGDSGLIEALQAAGGRTAFAGPGVIAVFASAVDALECALRWRESPAAIFCTGNWPLPMCWRVTWRPPGLIWRNFRACAPAIPWPPKARNRSTSIPSTCNGT